jgi:hypothetical protein
MRTNSKPHKEEFQHGGLLQKPGGAGPSPLSVPRPPDDLVSSLQTMSVDRAARVVSDPCARVLPGGEMPSQIRRQHFRPSRGCLSIAVLWRRFSRRYDQMRNIRRKFTCSAASAFMSGNMLFQGQTRLLRMNTPFFGRPLKTLIHLF